MSVEQTLWECFRYFVHMDESNAAIHCAPVRYSPITFRLMEALRETSAGPDDDNVDEDLADQHERVYQAAGKYKEDAGR